MMHDTSRAWSWRHAISLSDLPGDCKHLLLTLSLFMNEEGGSCFPEIETLMHRTGRGKTWVHKYLNIAEDAGWIVREQVARKRANGDNRGWRRNEYQACWPEKNMATEPAEPPPDSGDNCPEISPQNGVENGEKGGSRGEPPSEKVVRERAEGSSREGEKVVREANTNIPENIPENLSIARGRARGGAEAPLREGAARGPDGEGERESEPTRGDLEKRVQAYGHGKGFKGGEWPKWAEVTISYIVTQYLKLTPEERNEADRWRDAYLAKCKRPIGLGVWFRDRQWQALNPEWLKAHEASQKAQAAHEAEKQHERPPAKLFGREWGAARMTLVFDGPLTDKQLALYEQFSAKRIGEIGLEAWRQERRWAALMRFDRDAAARSWSAEGQGVFSRQQPALADLMVQVRIGSPEWAAWQNWHEAQAMPWLGSHDLGAVEWVYFPAGGPEGVEAFRARLTEPGFLSQTQDAAE